MSRRLFTFCSAVSLLLCVAVCVLWVRGYFVRDSVATCYPADGGFHWRFMESYRGRVHVVRAHYPVSGRLFDTYPWRLTSVRVPDGATWDRAYRGGRITIDNDVFGFAAVSVDSFVSDTPGANFGAWTWPIKGVVIPLWPFALAASGLPALWLRRFVRQRRRDRRGLCPACGYDLRATPERCPECGKVAVGR